MFEEGWLGPNGGAFPFDAAIAVSDEARENVETVYQLDSDPDLSADEQAFNEMIVRVAASKQVRDKDGIFTAETSSPHLTGEFTVPVVTLHTLGELFVPFHMQQVYARRVRDAGNADLLVQRAIRGRGHCEFLPGELIRAFDDLVNWVENSVKPDGDDILDPTTVAAPDFACRFTLETHPLAPPCP